MQEDETIAVNINIRKAQRNINTEKAENAKDAEGVLKTEARGCCAMVSI